MLHPSYTELIKIVNGDAEDHDTPVVNSRYSIVLATAKRARQIIDGQEPMSIPKVNKPLSVAVDEMKNGLLKVEAEPAEEETEELIDVPAEEAAEEITEDVAEEVQE